MEENKLPEKIYIHPDNDVMGEVLSQKVEGDVEYVRKDAFIEKVCEWLKENGGSYWLDDYDLPTDDLVNDFRSFMKGE